MIIWLGTLRDYPSHYRVQRTDCTPVLWYMYNGMFVTLWRAWALCWYAFVWWHGTSKRKSIRFLKVWAILKAWQIIFVDVADVLVVVRYPSRFYIGGTVFADWQNHSISHLPSSDKFTGNKHTMLSDKFATNVFPKYVSSICGVNAFLTEKVKKKQRLKTNDGRFYWSTHVL